MVGKRLFSASLLAESARRMSCGISIGIQTPALLKDGTKRGENDDFRRHAGPRRKAEGPALFLDTRVESDVGRVRKWRGETARHGDDSASVGSNRLDCEHAFRSRAAIADRDHDITPHDLAETPVQ